MNKVPDRKRLRREYLRTRRHLLAKVLFAALCVS
jgi:hypothetical protein